MKPKPITEFLGLAGDVLQELQTVVSKGQGVQPLVALLQWLDTDKALPATLARSAICSQAPALLGKTLALRWANKGLAVRVVNGPPPSLGGKSPPIDGGQRVKVKVPR